MEMQRKQIASLDGVRAIAIVLVLLQHVCNVIQPVNSFTYVFSIITQTGWIGVDLFFVLSGFLITGILIDTRNSPNYFTAFYARRVLRIFPIYYAALVILFAADRIFGSTTFSAALPPTNDRWLYFCYLSNWIHLWHRIWGLGANCLAHFWSLAVEEQFYLFWPLIVWLLPRKTLPWAAALIAVLSAIGRAAWMFSGGHSSEVAIATTSRLDSLMLGALTACLYRNARLIPRIRPFLPWLGAAFLGSFLTAYVFMTQFPLQTLRLLYGPNPVFHTLEESVRYFGILGGYSVLAIGFGALVLYSASTDGDDCAMQKILTAFPLTLIGRYSYGIYVFHFPIFTFADIYFRPRILPDNSQDVVLTFAYVITLWFVAFIVSALSYELFERRFLSLKRFFVASPCSEPSTMQKDSDLVRA